MISLICCKPSARLGSRTRGWPSSGLRKWVFRRPTPMGCSGEGAGAAIRMRACSTIRRISNVPVALTGAAGTRLEWAAAVARRAAYGRQLQAPAYVAHLKDYFGNLAFGVVR